MTMSERDKKLQQYWSGMYLGRGGAAGAPAHESEVRTDGAEPLLERARRLFPNLFAGAGAVQLDGKSEREAYESILGQLLPELRLDGEGDDRVRARLLIALEDAERDQASPAAARARMIKRNANEHKGKPAGALRMDAADDNARRSAPAADSSAPDPKAARERMIERGRNAHKGTAAS